MTEEEKARLILEGLETYLQIDYAFEEWYLKGIMIGLKKIKEKESNAATLDSN